MQLEFVKVLWRYDKRNAMKNGLILWMLIKGVIKENIFGDESLVEEVNKLNKLKMYLIPELLLSLNRIVFLSYKVIVLTKLRVANENVKC